jgi:hypothetical protein
MADIRYIVVPGHLRQKKFARPHLSGKQLGMVVHTCHPNYGAKCQPERSRSRPILSKK